MPAMPGRTRRSRLLAQRTPYFHNEIRRLRSFDKAALVDHFLRLDPDTRRLRFGNAVGDAFVKDYAESLLSADSVNFGAFPDGTLRGVAELRGLRDSWPRSAEVALAVEPAWQDRGIGDALFSRLVAAARNRGIARLHMICLQENVRMRHLALKHDARLEFDGGSIEATLTPAWPTPVSVFEEVFGDPRDYLPSALHLAG